MPTGSYDLIVIGSEPAGLIAGALCARRGMRVLVARTRRARPSYQLGPHTLPVGSMPFTGMRSRAVTRVLEELSFDHVLKRKLNNQAPAFQLVFPNARVDVSDDDEALARDLARELDAPDPTRDAFAAADVIADRIDDILVQDDTFPPTGFWKRRDGKSQSRVVDDAATWLEDADPVTSAMARLPAALSCAIDPGDLRPESCARVLALWRHGTARLAGDWQAFEDMVLDKLGNHAGEVRDVRIDQVTFSWGKATGIRLESGEELGAEHIIAAVPLDELQRLTTGKKSKRLTQCVEQIELAGYRYTLNLLVAEAGVPAGMARTVLLVGDPEAELTGDNALAIFVGEPDPEARVIVTIEATMPVPDGGQRLDDCFADLRVGIRRRLEDVMPFVGEHILLAHSPHEAIPAEGGDGVLELSEPLPARPLWRSRIDSHMGLSAVPYDVGVKRLTVASSQVLPGLGLEGAFETGWSAAHLASSGKKRDVAKEELLAAKR